MIQYTYCTQDATCNEPIDFGDGLVLGAILDNIAPNLVDLAALKAPIYTPNAGTYLYPQCGALRYVSE